MKKSCEKQVQHHVAKPKRLVHDIRFHLAITAAACLTIGIAQSVQAFDAVVPVSSLNGSNGFRMNSVERRGRFGKAVSNAGDINGDGIDDLIVGAPDIDSAFVLFGSAAGFNAAISTSSLNGANGFRLNDGGGATGRSVSDAGDINGDGIDDLIVGAYYAAHGGSYSGSSYVLFGSTSTFSATLGLSTLNGTNGFRLDGVGERDYSGKSVSGAGDINGDGIDDIIIGAPEADPNGIATSGSSYVLFGSTAGFASAFSLSTLDGTNGFRIDGSSVNDFSGRSVSDAGDINGDGIDDLIIGGYGANSFTGAGYVLFGSASGFAATLALSSLNGANGFRLDGITEYDSTGQSVSSAGDINGDGINDLVIGAPKSDTTSTGYAYNAGVSYVVFGSTAGFNATLSLSALNGTNGFALEGEQQDWAGSSVSGIGDINDDGVDDLLIGAEGGNAGYVVFGSTAGFNATQKLSSLNGNNGFRIDTSEGDQGLGSSVSSAGDINGDGFNDLIIGNRQYGSFSEGAAYVVFGQGKSDVIYANGFE